jgi:protoporphyrinogen oxidase
LEQDLRWTATGTGLYTHGAYYAMNGARDFLRFPLLTWLDKGRLAAALAYVTRVADPRKLHTQTAAAWLARICGQRVYQVLWQPLLRAKFGGFADQVSAVFLWATLRRLAGARSSLAQREKLGYVRGGYYAIINRLVARIAEARGRVRLNTKVVRIELTAAPGDRGCSIAFECGGQESRATFDLVVYTGPLPLACQVVAGKLAEDVADAQRLYPSSEAYLGIVCPVLVLRRPLTPYYVLNIAEPEIELTGVIETGNLLNRDQECAGRSLVYLPRYLGADDRAQARADGEFLAAAIDRGVTRMFPGFSRADIVQASVHRARHVQPLPLVRSTPPPRLGVPRIRGPFCLLNTAMLDCATLNNNEVVGLVRRFLAVNEAALSAQESRRLLVAGVVGQ